MAARDFRADRSMASAETASGASGISMASALAPISRRPWLFEDAGTVEVEGAAECRSARPLWEQGVSASRLRLIFSTIVGR